MTYVRITDNPKMGWSDERKAKFSETCKNAHANNTWHKKSKKAVSEAISNGLKAATKYRNRSNGQKRRHQNDQANIKRLQQVRIAEKALIEGLQDTVPILPNMERVLTQGAEEADRYCTNWDKINAELREGSDRPAPVEISKKHMDFIMELFDKIEAVFGIRPDVNEFVCSAIENKLQSVKDKLRKE